MELVNWGLYFLLGDILDFIIRIITHMLCVLVLNSIPQDQVEVEGEDLVVSLLIDCCGNIVVPTMRGQAKCADTFFCNCFRSRQV